MPSLPAGASHKAMTDARQRADEGSWPIAAPPEWLARWQRIRAALKDRRMLAEEDANALSLAFDASAAAGGTDELRTISKK